MSMKRRQFLGALATGGTGAALVPTAGAAEKATPLPPPPKISLVRTPLALMAPRADGLDAVWAVGRLAKGLIEWETTHPRAGSAM